VFFRKTTNISRNCIKLGNVLKGPQKHQTIYGFGKSSSCDLKIFDVGLGLFVGDVIIWATFRLFGHVYLALGAKPTSHILAQVFFWKLGYHLSL